jgi:hypothetical protein
MGQAAKDAGRGYGRSSGGLTAVLVDGAAIAKVPIKATKHKATANKQQTDVGWGKNRCRLSLKKRGREVKTI